MISEYEIILKAKKEEVDEKTLTEGIKKLSPRLSKEENREELNTAVRFAYGPKGLVSPAADVESAIRIFNKMKGLGFGEVTTNPPITDMELQELKPEPSVTEQEESISQEEIDTLLKGMATEESKPEMVEITLIGKNEDVKIIDAMRAIEPFVSNELAPKILYFWAGMEGAEVPVITVPKEKVNELREQLVAAGIIIEVPDPVEEVVASAVSKKQLDEIAAQLVALQELVKGIKTPETKVDLQPVVESLVTRLNAFDKMMIGMVGGITSDGKFNLASVMKAIGDAQTQIAGLPKPQPVDLQPVITAIGEIDIPEPAPIDLSPFNQMLTQIKSVFSETVEKVEEIKFEIFGGTADDGSTVGGLKSQMAAGFAGMASSEKAAKSAKRWAVGAFVLGMLIFGWLIVSSLISAPVKIDTKAIQAAVQAAMPNPLSNNAPTAADIVTEMKSQGLVVPATTSSSVPQVQVETGTETTTTTSGKRGGKH